MHRAIPDNVLKKHLAIVGMTGSGKTSTAKLAVEQVVDAGARVCILDPIKSDWWGLTSNASGKSAGLPFRILGGPRGHVALHCSAGKAIGQIVGEGKLPLSIIDMADFEPGGLQQFFVDFVPSLMRNMKGVLYLVIEEAHEFAPKEMAGFSKESLGVHYAKKLATAARSKGVRLIVATQRVQSLHNAVLGSCPTLIAQQLAYAADQEPVIKWLKGHIGKARASEVETTLASLQTGEGWIASGILGLFQRVEFPKFRTYDNNATPDDDAVDVDVKTTPVNQDELRAIIGDAVKEAEANDPVKLKAEVKRLQSDLAKQTAAVPAPSVVPDPAAMRDADAGGYSRGLNDGYDAGWRKGWQTGFVAGAVHAANRTAEMVRAIVATPTTAADIVVPSVPDPLGGPEPIRVDPPPPRRDTSAPPALPRAAPVSNIPTAAGTAHLPKAERKVMTALAQYPSGRTLPQIAILTGYAATGGGFRNAISALRTKGFVVDSPPLLIATESGLCGLGHYDPLPVGAELLRHWMSQLPKAERLALEAIASAFPSEISVEALAQATGYEPTGGGFRNALSHLRTLELISGSKTLRACEALFG